MSGCTHEWQVAPSIRAFRMSEPKWPAEPIELVAHVQAFTADTKFVQLKCRWCGTFAAARNELPITGPLFTEEVAP